MFYIYILYSAVADKYYVGYTNDYERRLVEHNTKPFSTFTSKCRPWLLKAVFKCGEIESEAMQIEKFIKRQKSRKLIEQLIQKDFIPSGILAQLVRVPYVRD
jgi:putative endonuclease